MDENVPYLLYADDEAKSHRYLKKNLGLECNFISSFEGHVLLKELQRIVHEPNPVVVLFSLRLNAGLTVDLLKKISAILPSARIILTVSYAEVPIATEAMKQGFIYDYFTKPWDLEKLKRGIERAVEDDRMEHNLKKLSAELEQFKPKDAVSANHLKDCEYDFFICHATEDKDVIARPLAEEIRKLHHRVWYDEFCLTVGDSLRENIDKGLRETRYGIVILSKSFFSKNWTQYELNGLVSREMDGHKVILPIWHGVTNQDVKAYSPSLADKFALSTGKMSLQEITGHLAKVL